MRKTKAWILLLLQLTVLLYTCAGMAGKFASGEELFSFRFLLFYGLEILLLGIYAILWQQMIARIDLSVAYANRSVNLLWTMLFAALLFHETITPANAAGVLLVMAGIFLVNSTGKQEQDKEAERSKTE